MSGVGKINAANEIRRFVNGFRSLLEEADSLEKLGSMENAEMEARNRLERIHKDIDAAEKKIEIAKAEAFQIISKAQADGERICREADEVKKKAEHTAGQKLAQASEHIKTNVANAERKLVDIGAEIDGLKSRRDLMRAEAEEAEKRRDEIMADLEAVKRKIST